MHPWTQRRLISIAFPALLERDVVTGGQFGEVVSQMAYGLLVLSLQSAVATEHLLLEMSEAFQRQRRTPAGEHVQHIHSPGGNGGQVISLWRTVATFIFTLSVGFNPTDFAKGTLGKTNSLTLFP